MNSDDKISSDISACRKRFVFDCEHLFEFCEKFHKATVGEQSESYLEVKLKDLEARWAKVELSYEKLRLKGSDTEELREVNKQIKEDYELCLDAYYNCNAQMLDLMKVLRLDSASAPIFQSTLRYSIPAQPFPQNPLAENSYSCIKLPPCDTEVFKGSYEQWPSFRDMFTAVYINHPKLTPVTKLYHLRSKTRGEAGAIVNRFPLSNDNFELAWQALSTRYENKRVLVDNQIKILFDIPSATKEDSESIRKIQSSVNDSLATLETLGIDVESWDPILIRLISTKLPETTLSLWEQSLSSPRELPKWKQMSQFLVDRYEAVERLTSLKSSKDCFTLKPRSHNTIQTFVSQENLHEKSCVLCNENHSLRTCPKFRKFTVQQRVDFVFKNKYCNNCLASSHLKANCSSQHTCLHCKKPHHTLLHIKQNFSQVVKKHENPQQTELFSNKNYHSPKTFSNSAEAERNNSQNELPQTSKQIQANCSVSNENILLRTAMMEIEHKGELFTIRALIDPGSQRTFLTEKIRDRLQLPFQKSQFDIIGIGGQRQRASRECELVLYARRYKLRVPIKAIVLPKVTKHLPTRTFDIPFSKQLSKLDLADPSFNKSAQIDLVLGNDYEHFVNMEGMRKNICGQTSAYKTIFGWVLSGPMTTQKIQAFSSSIQVSEVQDLNNLLKQFWEQEETPIAQSKSAEDEFCEKFYSKTTTRQEDGRYMVRLPFKSEFPKSLFLGPSRFIALAQYSRLEKTLAKNPNLQNQYQAVLDEYLALDHMEETSAQEISSEGKYLSYYLPHHAVVKPEHKTTKLRVVFNASRKTSSKFSLNDALYTGPILQNDLMTIILNWRKYKFVFSGDIEKMYRQILVHPSDRQFQRILYQSHPSSPVKDYHLKTVTFGVSAAPYLAIRTLLQLATDSESLYPKAATILRTEAYVDDILSGGFTIQETQEAQSQLIRVLKSAGFPLKKITSNDSQLLTNLPKEDLYDSNFLQFHETSSTKTLGIKWNALNDFFTYSFSPIEQATKITKRQILSSVAKLFDPAGWLAPIIIRAKILMQQLWLEGVQWDEEVSEESRQNWINLVEDLSKIETISISRWLQYTPSDNVQIHGFSDASKLAYCAAVYVRCQTTSHTTFINLLVAKSKVAPIQTVCLPRLELNGAVLLAKLVNHINASLNLNPDEIFLWTDSSIVLGWLSKPPSTWETYVANRTSQIHHLVPKATWRHVSTHDNPADLGTRGSRPQDLSQNQLWWHGPTWLQNPSSEWPKRNPLKEVQKPCETQSFHAEVEPVDTLIQFSTYSKALRVICYAFRFFHNSIRPVRPNSEINKSLNLTLNETKFAKNRLIMLAQKSFYRDDYQSLISSQIISNKSSLKNLNPFIDSHSLMRVNGRLAQASLPYSERYPIILPGNSRFAHLYLTFLHEFLVHAECTLMQRVVQTEFYISRLKPKIKNIIRHCKKCIIYKQQCCTQLMAPLPAERSSFSPPFQITGVDFAGPFELKSSTLRKSPTVKAYVSVFVCFSTKAVHLELCSDLTTLAFQAAFARFVGRRGLPQRVMSDNGRNFIGASRAFKLEFEEFVKNVSQDISQKYITHGFEWKFIPPYAPHMGGLWEAAVKSFKFHLKRLSGSQRFTFEELSTILTRIEGVLNSRPISALSNDPSDLTALTPGHFLRGAPIMALPEQSFESMSVINRWEKLKALHHQFTLRWKEDYLKSLHKRYKWRNSTPNLRVGDLVVVIDDMLPPHEWRLGRVETTHPAIDKNVRIVDIRTASGIITRPIVKLCYLPFLNEENMD